MVITKDTSRKIKAVKEQKYEKGYYMEFIAPYGYKKVRAEDGRITLKIDENVSRIVKIIFQKIIKGKSIQKYSQQKLIIVSIT